MKYPYWQGGMDSLCGVYSIVNADNIINNSSDENSQELFNTIIEYLSKKRKLKDVIVGGVYHKNVLEILENVCDNRFQWKIIGNNFKNIKTFWESSFEFLEKENKAIILSIGGKDNHLTVVKKMTNKKMFLFDSSGYISLNISSCRLPLYTKKDNQEDKYIIYPSQSFFCWK